MIKNEFIDSFLNFFRFSISSRFRSIFNVKIYLNLYQFRIFFNNLILFNNFSNNQTDEFRIGLTPEVDF